jgi:hypothetical protein
MGQALLILSIVGFFGSFLGLGGGVAHSQSQILLRSALGAGLSFAVLCIASFTLRQVSMLWFVPLYCFAVSILIIGVATLVTILFRHWQLLASRLGAAGFVCVGVGAVGVWSMKRRARSRLQSKHGG